MSPAGHGSRRAIGVFDSGVGGLTVVRELRRVLPYEEIIYLGDTARVPYGNKSPETVTRFAIEDTQFLLGQNVKVVVVACNTASAWALPALERRFNVPIFGVILPGARLALEQTKNFRIGVIATNATIRSQAYNRALLARNDSVEVFARACPLLVPLVEEGWIRHSVTLSVLHEYLEPLLRKNIDTLVLGCTHYPIIKSEIRKVVGRKVRLVDSAQSCAGYVKERLKALKLLNPSRRKANIQPFVTDDIERFGDVAQRFLGEKIGPAQKVLLAPARSRDMSMAS